MRVSAPGGSGTRPGTWRVPAPEDPGASPGGVELVMSPGLALRKPGSTRAGLSTHRLGPDDPRQPDPRPIPSRLAPRERVLTREIVTRPARTSAGDTISRIADDLATRAARPVRRRGRGSRRGPSWPPARPTRTSSSTPAREPARARRRDFGLDNTHPIYVITTKPPKFIQRAHGGALLFGPSICGWTTVVQPSFSRVECASRGPGCSGAGRRGPRDRWVIAEHVT